MAIPPSNVYQPAGRRLLWHFAGAGSSTAELKAVRELPLTGSEPPPKHWVAKGWSAFLNRRLNLAWLPPGTAFIRAVTLPVMPREELVAAIEFQLEKLSPLPPTHIVWSVEALPQVVNGQQTVLVLIAARQQVEQVLGQLEAQGYLADRLEVPALDLLMSVPAQAEGLWLYPPQEGAEACWLAAWWSGGLLRHVGMIHLPEGENRGRVLQDQLRLMAWAGEVEGWLAGPAPWHLVADSVSAALWEPLVREIAGGPVTLITPPPVSRLAGQTVKRAAAALAAKLPGLLPAETAQQYRARFVDGLWMSSLTTLFAVYLVAVLAYFGYLEFLEYRLTRAEAQVAAVSGTYTNAQQIKFQVQILQEQQNLKYAALEVWDAVARTLPQELTLQSLNFSRERTLTLYGTVTEGNNQAVFDFNNALKQVEFNGRPLFVKVAAPFLDTRQGRWNFTCELNRLE
jgi:hypothetical protein